MRGGGGGLPPKRRKQEALVLNRTAAAQRSHLVGVPSPPLTVAASYSVRYLCSLIGYTQQPTGECMHGWLFSSTRRQV